VSDPGFDSSSISARRDWYIALEHFESNGFGRRFWIAKGKKLTVTVLFPYL